MCFRNSSTCFLIALMAPLVVSFSIDTKATRFIPGVESSQDSSENIIRTHREKRQTRSIGSIPTGNNGVGSAINALQIRVPTERQKLVEASSSVNNEAGMSFIKNEKMISINEPGASPNRAFNFPMADATRQINPTPLHQRSFNFPGIEPPPQHVDHTMVTSGQNHASSAKVGGSSNLEVFTKNSNPVIQQTQELSPRTALYNEIRKALLVHRAGQIVKSAIARLSTANSQVTKSKNFDSPAPGTISAGHINHLQTRNRPKHFDNLRIKQLPQRSFENRGVHSSSSRNQRVENQGILVGILPLSDTMTGAVQDQFSLPTHQELGMSTGHTHVPPSIGGMPLNHPGAEVQSAFRVAPSRVSSFGMPHVSSPTSIGQFESGASSQISGRHSVNGHSAIQTSGTSTGHQNKHIHNAVKADPVTTRATTPPTTVRATTVSSSTNTKGLAANPVLSNSSSSTVHISTSTGKKTSVGQPGQNQKLTPPHHPIINLHINFHQPKNSQSSPNLVVQQRPAQITGNQIGTPVQQNALQHAGMKAAKTQSVNNLMDVNVINNITEAVIASLIQRNQAVQLLQTQQSSQNTINRAPPSGGSQKSQQFIGGNAVNQPSLSGGGNAVNQPSLSGGGNAVNQPSLSGGGHPLLDTVKKVIQQHLRNSGTGRQQGTPSNTASMPVIQSQVSGTVNRNIGGVQHSLNTVNSVPSASPFNSGLQSVPQQLVTGNNGQSHQTGVQSKTVSQPSKAQHITATQQTVNLSSMRTSNPTSANQNMNTVSRQNIQTGTAQNFPHHGGSQPMVGAQMRNIQSITGNHQPIQQSSVHSVVNSQQFPAQSVSKAVHVEQGPRTVLSGQAMSSKHKALPQFLQGVGSNANLPHLAVPNLSTNQAQGSQLFQNNPSKASNQPATSPHGQQSIRHTMQTNAHGPSTGNSVVQTGHLVDTQVMQNSQPVNMIGQSSGTASAIQQAGSLLVDTGIPHSGNSVPQAVNRQHHNVQPNLSGSHGNAISKQTIVQHNTAHAPSTGGQGQSNQHEFLEGTTGSQINRNQVSQQGSVVNTISSPTKRQHFTSGQRQINNHQKGVNTFLAQNNRQNIIRELLPGTKPLQQTMSPQTTIQGSTVSTRQANFQNNLHSHPVGRIMPNQGSIGNSISSSSNSPQSTLGGHVSTNNNFIQQNKLEVQPVDIQFGKQQKHSIGPERSSGPKNHRSNPSIQTSVSQVNKQQSSRNIKSTNPVNPINVPQSPPSTQVTKLGITNPPTMQQGNLNIQLGGQTPTQNNHMMTNEIQLSTSPNTNSISNTPKVNPLPNSVLRIPRPSTNLIDVTNAAFINGQQSLGTSQGSQTIASVHSSSGIPPANAPPLTQSQTKQSPGQSPNQVGQPSKGQSQRQIRQQTLALSPNHPSQQMPAKSSSQTGQQILGQPEIQARQRSTHQSHIHTIHQSPVQSQSPTRQQPAVQSQFLTLQQPAVQSQSPTRQQPPVQSQSPTRHQPTVQSQSPTRQQPPVQSQSPTRHQPTVQSQSPTRQQPPVQSQSPTRQQPAVQAQSPTRQQPAVQSQSPTRHQPTVQSQSPTRQQPPVQSQSPTRQQPAVQSQSPTRQQPAVQSQSVTRQQPAVQAQSQKRQQPAVQSQSVTRQQPAVQAQSQKRQQPAVQSQSPTRQQPPVQSQSPTRQQPAVQSQSVTRQQPAVQSQSVTRQQPAVQSQSPTRPQPAVQAQSPTRQQPTLQHSSQTRQQSQIRQTTKVHPSSQNRQQKPVKSPSQTRQRSPVQTPIETKQHTLAPSQTIQQTPAQISSQTTQQLSGKPQSQTGHQPSSQSHIQNMVQSSVQFPVKPPNQTSAPVQSANQVRQQTPVQHPSQIRQQSAAKPQRQIEKQSAGPSQSQTLQQSSRQSHIQITHQSPGQSQSQIRQQTPVQSPIQARQKSPVQSPIQSKQQSPAQHSIESRQQTPAKPPSLTKQQTPAQSPIHAGQKLPRHSLSQTRELSPGHSQSARPPFENRQQLPAQHQSQIGRQSPGQIRSQTIQPSSHQSQMQKMHQSPGQASSNTRQETTIKTSSQAKQHITDLSFIPTQPELPRQNLLSSGPNNQLKSVRKTMESVSTSTKPNQPGSLQMTNLHQTSQHASSKTPPMNNQHSGQGGNAQATQTTGSTQRAGQRTKPSQQMPVTSNLVSSAAKSNSKNSASGQPVSNANHWSTTGQQDVLSSQNFMNRQQASTIGWVSPIVSNVNRNEPQQFDLGGQRPGSAGSATGQLNPSAQQNRFTPSSSSVTSKSSSPVKEKTGTQTGQTRESKRGQGSQVLNSPHGPKATANTKTTVSQSASKPSPTTAKQSQGTLSSIQSSPSNQLEIIPSTSGGNVNNLNHAPQRSKVPAITHANSKATRGSKLNLTSPRVLHVTSQSNPQKEIQPSKAIPSPPKRNPPSSQKTMSPQNHHSISKQTVTSQNGHNHQSSSSRVRNSPNGQLNQIPSQTTRSQRVQTSKQTISQIQAPSKVQQNNQIITPITKSSNVQQNSPVASQMRTFQHSQHRFLTSQNGLLQNSPSTSIHTMNSNVLSRKMTAGNSQQNAPITSSGMRTSVNTNSQIKTQKIGQQTSPVVSSQTLTTRHEPPNHLTTFPVKEIRQLPSISSQVRTNGQQNSHQTSTTGKQHGFQTPTTQTGQQLRESQKRQQNSPTIFHPRSPQSGPQNSHPSIQIRASQSGQQKNQATVDQMRSPHPGQHNSPVTSSGTVGLQSGQPKTHQPSTQSGSLLKAVEGNTVVTGHNLGTASSTGPITAQHGVLPTNNQPTGRASLTNSSSDVLSSVSATTSQPNSHKGTNSIINQSVLTKTQDKSFKQNINMVVPSPDTPSVVSTSQAFTKVTLQIDSSVQSSPSLSVFSTSTPTTRLQDYPSPHFPSASHRTDVASGQATSIARVPTPDSGKDPMMVTIARNTNSSVETTPGHTRPSTAEATPHKNVPVTVSTNTAVTAQTSTRSSVTSAEVVDIDSTASPTSVQEKNIKLVVKNRTDTAVKTSYKANPEMSLLTAKHNSTSTIAPAQANSSAASTYSSTIEFLTKSNETVATTPATILPRNIKKRKRTKAIPTTVKQTSNSLLEKRTNSTTATPAKDATNNSLTMDTVQAHAVVHTNTVVNHPAGILPEVNKGKTLTDAAVAEPLKSINTVISVGQFRDNSSAASDPTIVESLATSPNKTYSSTDKVLAVDNSSVVVVQKGTNLTSTTASPSKVHSYSVSSVSASAASSEAASSQKSMTHRKAMTISPEIRNQKVSGKTRMINDKALTVTSAANHSDTRNQEAKNSSNHISTIDLPTVNAIASQILASLVRIVSQTSAKGMLHHNSLAIGHTGTSLKAGLPTIPGGSSTTQTSGSQPEVAIASLRSTVPEPLSQTQPDTVRYLPSSARQAYDHHSSVNQVSSDAVYFAAPIHETSSKQANNVTTLYSAVANVTTVTESISMNTTTLLPSSATRQVSEFSSTAGYQPTEILHQTTTPSPTVVNETSQSQQAKAQPSGTTATHLSALVDLAITTASPKQTEPSRSNPSLQVDLTSQTPPPRPSVDGLLLHSPPALTGHTTPLEPHSLASLSQNVAESQTTNQVSDQTIARITTPSPPVQSTSQTHAQPSVKGMSTQPHQTAKGIRTTTQISTITTPAAQSKVSLPNNETTPAVITQTSTHRPAVESEKPQMELRVESRIKSSQAIKDKIFDHSQPAVARYSKSRQAPAVDQTASPTSAMASKTKTPRMNVPKEVAKIHVDQIKQLQSTTQKMTKGQNLDKGSWKTTIKPQILIVTTQPDSNKKTLAKPTAGSHVPSNQPMLSGSEPNTSARTKVSSQTRISQTGLTQKKTSSTGFDLGSVSHPTENQLDIPNQTPPKRHPTIVYLTATAHHRPGMSSIPTLPLPTNHFISLQQPYSGNNAASKTMVGPMTQINKSKQGKTTKMIIQSAAQRHNVEKPPLNDVTGNHSDQLRQSLNRNKAHLSVTGQKALNRSTNTKPDHNNPRRITTPSPRHGGGATTTPQARHADRTITTPLSHIGAQTIAKSSGDHVLPSRHGTELISTPQPRRRDGTITTLTSRHVAQPVTTSPSPHGAKLISTPPSLHRSGAVITAPPRQGARTITTPRHETITTPPLHHGAGTISTPANHGTIKLQQQSRRKLDQTLNIRRTLPQEQTPIPYTIIANIPSQTEARTDLSNLPRNIPRKHTVSVHKVGRPSSSLKDWEFAAISAGIVSTTVSPPWSRSPYYDVTVVPQVPKGLEFLSGSQRRERTHSNSLLRKIISKSMTPVQSIHNNQRVVSQSRTSVLPKEQKKVKTSTHQDNRAKAEKSKISKVVHVSPKGEIHGLTKKAKSSIVQSNFQKPQLMKQLISSHKTKTDPIVQPTRQASVVPLTETVQNFYLPMDVTTNMPEAGRPAEGLSTLAPPVRKDIVNSMRNTADVLRLLNNIVHKQSESTKTENTKTNKKSKKKSSVDNNVGNSPYSVSQIIYPVDISLSTLERLVDVPNGRLNPVRNV